MKSALTVLFAGSLLLPAAAEAQQFELDVARRTFPFIENRLEVAVVSAAPGELQIVRGHRGRIDVAARAVDGFPAFGLGGGVTPSLRLTTAGNGQVNYVVVVPERVSVHVVLPDGRSSHLAPSAAAAAWRWAAISEVAPPTGEHAEPGHPGTRPAATGGARQGGFSNLMLDPGSAGRGGDYVAPTTSAPSRSLPVMYASERVPRIVDVPDLGSVRSLSVRVEGDEFRIAASRPLVLEPGSSSRFELRIAGEPLDLVLYVPPTAAFALQSGTMRIAQAVYGRTEALCGNVIVMEPSAQQTWLSFHPQQGRLDCH
jgi:hypothetical protein